MKHLIFILTIFVLVIMTSCKKFPDLGKGYKLEYNSRGDIGIVNSVNSYLVYGHILEYTFDSTFILVAERPRDSIQECTGTIPGMTAKKCNEAFEKSTFLQYWIINKKEKSEYSLDTLAELARYSNVYGPFKEDEFLVKRKELGVPDKLKFTSK